MKSTVQTRKHALEVYEYILKNPEKHNQKHFFVEGYGQIGDDGSHCGTAMCVAGTSAFIANNKNWYKATNASDVEGNSAKRLGLSGGEIHALFYEMDEAAALNKLRKVVVGKSFSKKDFKTSEY